MDQSLVGDWTTGWREFSIVADSGALWLRCPAAPPGFEARLVDMAPGRVRIEGGPLHGAEIVVEEEGDFSLGGHRPLERLDRPAEAGPGWGMMAPAEELEPDEIETFQHLWTWLAHPSRAPEVDLGGCDLYRFVRWLDRNGLALFHGDERIDLDRLPPTDWPAASHGEPEAGEFVYATADALCSMFLAIVDPESTGRSAIQRVEHFRSLEGDEVDIYQFHYTGGESSTCLRPGGLYLLPRDRFRPLSIYPGGPISTEWVSLEPVTPLACLVTTPGDFPFTDRFVVSA